MTCLRAMTLLALAALPSTATAEGYRFLFPDAVVAQIGAEIEIDVEGDYEQSVQGFSMAFSFDPERIEFTGVSFEDTILEAIDTDFESVRIETDVVHPVTRERVGVVSVGVLVDTQPPFNGSLIPAIGQPLRFFTLGARIPEDGSDDVVLTFEDGLLEPPIENIFVVDNQAVPLTELPEVVIDVRGGEQFLRGDVNQDSTRDVSDPLAALNYMFGRGREPDCLRAADANDDESVNLSDVIFLLNYLFDDGLAPAAPTLGPGIDPTPGQLSCHFPPG